MPESFKCTAPATLMLFGEHAVLHGHHALSCAVDKYLEVCLKPRRDDKIEITSALGSYMATTTDIPYDPTFSFVTKALQSKWQLLPSGCTIEISSQFSHLFGLGSSAAVTAATLGALSLWLQSSIDKEQLFHESLAIIRSVQGIASGADVAASIFGSIVYYRMDPCQITPLPHLFPLTVVYSGSKMATKQVIQHVRSRYEKEHQLYDALFASMGEVSKRAKEAICLEDWQTLGQLANMQQGLMDAIGVNTHALSDIVYQMRAQAQILGSKISGSGLGDCVIGFGHAPSFTTSYPQLQLQMSPQGIRYE
ncbi:MAG: mevalonate kinase [Verrucomicrobia bacterium]|nr:mevalonate kinase [Verrucomicrobiota bacterium]